MNSQNNQNKKKKGSGGTILVVLLILLLPRLLELLEDGELGWYFNRFLLNLQLWLYRSGIRIRAEIVVMAALFLLVFLIALLAGSARRRKNSEEAGRSTNSTAGRTNAAANRYDPRTRSFTAPEPSCVVCDHTGEDHFVHDKQQRIAQLDEWLKNGIVDKEEYWVLKSRFERDL